MRLFCDVCVSFAYVCAVFQTFLCVLTLHIRRFSDKYVCISDVYITFSTQALLYSGACIRFAMYVLLFRMFALCFKRYCVFWPDTFAGFRTHMWVSQMCPSQFPHMRRIFSHMRSFCDVCACLADICVVFLTYMSVLNQHMRRFFDMYEFWSYVYIIIVSQELLLRCLRYVSNVYVCSYQTHTLIFGQRHVFIWGMRHFGDVCVSEADVRIVFQTYICVFNPADA